MCVAPFSSRGGDLAVEHHRAAEAGERVERRSEEFCAVVPIAAQKPQGAPTVRNRDEAMPIDLDLVQPAVAGRRLGG
jgi:hypothetical protein